MNCYVLFSYFYKIKLNQNKFKCVLFWFIKERKKEKKRQKLELTQKQSCSNMRATTVLLKIIFFISYCIEGLKNFIETLKHNFMRSKKMLHSFYISIFSIRFSSVLNTFRVYIFGNIKNSFLFVQKN